MSVVRVQTVRGGGDLLRFIKFPWKIYAGDPHWVPPLIVERKRLLDPTKNPFFKHAEMQLFLAERDGELVGRIAAIVDHLYNSFHQEKIGFFGFFESIDDSNVSTALFDATRDWLKSRGLAVMRGPTNPSMNDEIGLLIDGFDDTPSIMLPYNPPYYARLCDIYGLKKVMDLYCYYLHKDFIEHQRVERLAELIRRRNSVQICTIDMKNFHDEVEKVKMIYNRAWEKNWGFVPLTDDEIDSLAQNLKPILDPDLGLFADVNGKSVGFALALPDFNQVLRRIPTGRLFPLGWLKVLRYRSKIDRVRLFAAGVIPEYQKRGIDALFYSELFRRGTSKGIYQGEAGWVLESNTLMNNGLEALNAKRCRTYRMYDMNLS